jgi:hypothetical protein
MDYPLHRCHDLPEPMNLSSARPESSPVETPLPPPACARAVLRMRQGRLAELEDMVVDEAPVALTASRTP